MSHLPVTIDISRRRRPRGGRGLRQRKRFAEFRGQVTQLIESGDTNRIREVKNYEEFSDLFESPFEWATSIIAKKTLERANSLPVPATSLTFREVYGRKSSPKELSKKACKPQLLEKSDPKLEEPIINLSSESESSIINLSSDSETEVPSDAETISPQNLERNRIVSGSELQSGLKELKN